MAIYDFIGIFAQWSFYTFFMFFRGHRAFNSFLGLKNGSFFCLILSPEFFIKTNRNQICRLYGNHRLGNLNGCLYAWAM